MNWIVPAWGPGAVVYAGMGTKDHLRVAFQLLSEDVREIIVYCHLGWRRISDTWYFLHAGGAIGPNGLVEDIPVALPEALANFKLSCAQTTNHLREAVLASLALLELGPDRLMFPIFAAVYRAALGDTDFALHLCGPTGSYKSEVAALAQQHYGPDMDSRHLPANWSSTGNALEAIAFAAKDNLLTVDDFCPTGSTSDVQRYHREADRLFRGQGNRSGRQRLRADATMRPSKPPRGLAFSTGEDTPRSQSLRARLFVIEAGLGDFGPPPPNPNPLLSARQQDARDGRYAVSLAGYIKWLAPKYEEIRAGLRAELTDLRNRASGAGQHARTPGIVADLALGLRYFLEYARSIAAVSEDQSKELWGRGWAALCEAGELQAQHITTAEPAGMFLRLLSGAIASGRAHIADTKGGDPKDPERWGWRSRTVGNGDHARVELQAQGYCVGWIDGENLYLEPEATFAEAQRLASEQGDSLPVTAQTLRRRLRDKGHLAAWDKSRGKLTVRKVLQGTRREVLHLSLASTSLFETGPTGPGASAIHESPSHSWAGSWAGNGHPNGKPAQQPAHEIHDNSAENGEMGRLGQSSVGTDTACGEKHSEHLSTKTPPGRQSADREVFEV